MAEKLADNFNKFSDWPLASSLYEREPGRELPLLVRTSNMPAAWPDGVRMASHICDITAVCATESGLRELDRQDYVIHPHQLGISHG
jgi:hypothetical protein